MIIDYIPPIMSLVITKPWNKSNLFSPVMTFAVRWTDHPNMTIAVDWDVKHQTKHIIHFKIRQIFGPFLGKNKILAFLYLPQSYIQRADQAKIKSLHSYIYLKAIFKGQTIHKKFSL